MLLQAPPPPRAPYLLVLPHAPLPSSAQKSPLTLLLYNVTSGAGNNTFHDGAKNSPTLSPSGNQHGQLLEIIIFPATTALTAGQCTEGSGPGILLARGHDCLQKLQNAVIKPKERGLRSGFEAFKSADNLIRRLCYHMASFIPLPTILLIVVLTFNHHFCILSEM